MKREGKKHERQENFFRYSYLIIILVPLLLYIGSLRSGFVYMDDDGLILDNFSKNSQLSTIVDAFRRDVFLSNTYLFYRPLMSVAFVIQAHIGDKNPFIYHFGNLFLHILCCLSLFWILGLSGFNRGKALAGTLLFTVHPLMSKAVLLIPAQNDLLVTLFALISAGCLITYTRNKKIIFLILHLLGFTGALFSKESAFMLPFLFIVYMIVMKKKIFQKSNLFLVSMWVVICVFWFWLRSHAIGHNSFDLTGIYPLLTNLPFLAEIVSKFILPFKLAVMPVFSWYHTITGIVLIFVIILLILLRKAFKNPYVIFGVVWFIVFAIPNMYLRIYHAADNFDYIEHRAYLPAAGMIFIFLALIPDKFSSIQKKFIMPAFIAILALFTLLTFLQQKNYRNGANFWNSAISDTPDHARFYYGLGRYYFKQNDYDNFEKYLLQAIKLKQDPEFLYHLGMVNWVARKDYDKAYTYLSNSAEKLVNTPEAKKNYINFCIESSLDLFNKGQYLQAAERGEAAVRKDPGNALAWDNLGTYYVFLKLNQKAIGSWKRALALNPGLKDAWCNLFIYYRNNTTLRDSVIYYGTECQKHGGDVDPKSLIP